MEESKKFEEEKERLFSSITIKGNENNEDTSNLYDRFWSFSKKSITSFPDAMIGFKSKKTVLGDKVLNEFKEYKTLEQVNLQDINELYNLSFQDNKEIYAEFHKLDKDEIESITNSRILSKVITGSEDSKIGAFIDFLGNSDWVKKGLAYTDIESKNCPFCQEPLANDRLEEIISYFDDQYEKDIEDLETYCKAYNRYFQETIMILREIIQSNNPLLELEPFKLVVDIFENTVRLNLEEIKKKVNSPSVIIELRNIEDLVDNVNLHIDEFNTMIRRNNEVVSNLKKSTRAL